MTDDAQAARGFRMVFYPLVVLAFASLTGALRWCPPQHRGDIFSLVFAVIFLVLGAMCVVGAQTTGLGRSILRTDSDALSHANRRQLRLQGLSFVLAGLLMAVPPLVLWRVATGPTADAVAFVCIAAGVGGLMLINVMLWKACDEFQRRIALETYGLSFWVVQSALFLWAVAERLGYAPALSGWNAYTALIGIYLGVAAVVSVRMTGK